MVEKLSQIIRAKGFRFDVQSEEPLTAEMKDLFVEALEEYPKGILRALSRGKKGEPPLKIIFAENERWPDFIPTPYFIITGFNQAASAGSYNQFENMVFVAPVGFLESLFGSNLRYTFQHEINHAIDDFGYTMFQGDFETGSIVDDLPYLFGNIFENSDLVKYVH